MVGLDGLDLAEPAVLEAAPDDVDVREEAGPHRLHGEQASSPGRFDDGRASAALRVNAFSTSTGLPASRASRAWSWCSECGLAT